MHAEKRTARKRAREREREKKRNRKRKRERESSQRKNSNTIWGDKEDGRIIPKGPCHIYIWYHIYGLQTNAFLVLSFCLAKVPTKHDAKTATTVLQARICTKMVLRQRVRISDPVRR
jgi:hypothetical protein